MRVRLQCTNENCRAGYETQVSDSTSQLCCPRCGRQTPWNAGALQTGTTKDCPLCGCEELFLRKDFPQKVGLLLVVAVGVASCWLFARGELLWSLGILLGLVIVDLVIYRLVPKMTVCYRCRAEFRDAPLNPDHAGFDLATAEKYR